VDTSKENFDLTMLAPHIWIKSVQHSTSGSNEYGSGKIRFDLGGGSVPPLVDNDDEPFLAPSLAKAMEKRGFRGGDSGPVAAALRSPHSTATAYAVVDLRLQDGNGLDVVEVADKRRCAGCGAERITGPSPPPLPAVKNRRDGLSVKTGLKCTDIVKMRCWPRRR